MLYTPVYSLPGSSKTIFTIFRFHITVSPIIALYGRKRGLEELEVELSEQETKSTFELRDKYRLIVVESIPNNPRS